MTPFWDKLSVTESAKYIKNNPNTFTCYSVELAIAFLNHSYNKKCKEFAETIINCPLGHSELSVKIAKQYLNKFTQKNQEPC